MNITPWKLRVQKRIQDGTLPDLPVKDRLSIARYEAMQEEINDLHTALRNEERVNFRMRIALVNASKKLSSTEDCSNLPTLLMRAAQDGLHLKE